MANFSNRTNCVDDIKACDVNNLFLDITSTSSGHLHDGSNGRQHTSGTFKLKETSGCYNFIFVTSCIAADRNVTLPALSGNATFGFIDIAQSFTAAQTITTDADSEFVALKLTNQSDSANTCGFVTLEFDLEDTGGNAVDAAKISVKKEASFTATASTQDAKMEFALSLNGTMTERMTLASTGNLSIDGDLTVSGGDITVGTTAVITGGDTTSLDNIDALNATTEATIEGAIDTLSNLGTIGKACATTNIVAGDITMYNAVNGGNPTISLGAGSAERLVITANYDSSAQTLCNIEFATAAASATGDKGKMVFDIDGTDIATIDDSGINLASGKTFRVNGSALADSDTTYSAGTLLDLCSTTFNVDLTEAAECTIANGDYILFLDGGATGTAKKEAFADMVGVIAGTVTTTGLSDSAGVMKLDIQNMTASCTINCADLVVIDDGANGTLRKMTRANFVSGIGASENCVITMTEVLMYY
jgi:hypothetical protein